MAPPAVTVTVPTAAAPLGEELQHRWLPQETGRLYGQVRWWMELFFFKAFHGFIHPVLLGVGTNLITIGSHKPATRK